LTLALCALPCRGKSHRQRPWNISMAAFCGFFSGLVKTNKANECQQFLIVGPEQSGKTTLMYRLRMGDRWPEMEQDLKDMANELYYKPDSTVDHLYDAGYHYEEFEMLNNCGFWDVPGKMRTVWSTFYKALTIHGVIFVVDANDAKLLESENKRQREEANQKVREYRQLLHSLMNEDELRSAVISVIFNSRNADAEPPPDEHPLRYRYGLHNLPEPMKKRVGFFVLDCNRLNGETDPNWKPIEDHMKRVLKETFDLEFD